jgi:hypothetical protein
MKKINNKNLANGVEVIFESPEEKSFFFGYYNYSPMNIDGNKLLAHKANFEGRMPNASDKVEIGYFDLENNNKWNVLSQSKAFNWQQGSMLQWLGPDFNSQIIFNDVESGRFVSRIVNVATKEIKTIPHAVYGIMPDGKFSISLNFERCYWTRAYSYAPIVDESWNKRIPEEDGIVKINLKTGQKETIIKINDFLKLQGIEDDGTTSHWFEHIMLNPDATRFAFHYRYGNKDAYLTRSYTADINGKNIWKHPAQEDARFSHLGWKDNNHYVLFSNHKTKATKWIGSNKKSFTKRFLRWSYRRTLKPFFKGESLNKVVGNSHYALTRDGDKVIEKINFDMLSRDGHPSFTSDGRFMLTDTYQDEGNFRHLLLCDIEKKICEELGSFFSTYNNCGWRADLHPRFSRDEKFVIIDSTHNGYHQMMLLKIDFKKLGIVQHSE